MPADFEATYAALKPLLARHAKRLSVKADTPTDYLVLTKSPSPFPQHKGQPMHFGAIRVGKAYVSYHLMPVYMEPALMKSMSPALMKRMQGKACFNFKTVPEREVLAELKSLTDACLKSWAAKKWL